MEDQNPALTELYDPGSNTFAPGPSLNVLRQSHTATVLDSGPNAGAVLLVGGWGKKLDPLASTELYDPVTNTFAPPSATATMKIARSLHTATLLFSGPNTGKILIAGGQQDDDRLLSSTELYDPATNRFAPGPAMYSRRTQHAAMTITSGPNAGKILIAGGEGMRYGKSGGDCVSTSLASTELYDPATNTFALGPLMRGAPGRVVAVQLPPAPPVVAKSMHSRAAE